jgi:ADP-heptose:LPS heptosyltransferase
MDSLASGFKTPRIAHDSSSPMDRGEHPLPTKGNEMDKGTSSVSTNPDETKNIISSSKHTEVHVAIL